jgi:peptide/nickel transport system substrate-binding protein
MKSWMRPVRAAGYAAGIGAMVASVALVPAYTRFAPAALAQPANASGHTCVNAIGSGDNPFVRNFNPYANPVDFSWGGVYEPLTYYVPSGKRYYWLAQKMTFTNGGKSINLTLRNNVTWNDGKPFTSADVVYTLEAG